MSDLKHIADILNENPIFDIGAPDETNLDDKKDATPEDTDASKKDTSEKNPIENSDPKVENNKIENSDPNIENNKAENKTGDNKSSGENDGFGKTNVEDNGDKSKSIKTNSPPSRLSLSQEVKTVFDEFYIKINSKSKQKNGNLIFKADLLDAIIILAIGSNKDRKLINENVVDFLKHDDALKKSDIKEILANQEALDFGLQFISYMLYCLSFSEIGTSDLGRFSERLLKYDSDNLINVSKDLLKQYFQFSHDLKNVKGREIYQKKNSK